MRALALFFPLLVFSSGASAKCEGFFKAADYLDANTFIQASKKRHSLKGSKELQVKLLDSNQARSYSYYFAPFEEMGFGLPGTKGWESFVSNMDSSTLNGLKVGFKKKMPNGDFARIRLDWDPQKGAHYNIEMTIKSNPYKAGTYKMAVGFDCNGKPCSQSDILKLARPLNN